MELNQLKTIFDSGGLKSVVVTPIEMKKGYLLIFKDKESNNHIMTSQRSDKLKHEPRVFKTIDAAIANANKIGFKKMAVEL